MGKATIEEVVSTIELPFGELEFRESDHVYRLNGTRIPSVTQILRIIDKSGPLTWWAQGIGVEGVLELVQRKLLEGGAGYLAHSDGVATKESIVKLLTAEKLTTNHQKQAAGTRGRSVHAAAQVFADTGKLPIKDHFPEEDQGYVDAFAQWVLDEDPEFLQTEFMVASEKYQYAGTVDARIRRKNGEAWLVDFKTSKGVYDTMLMQVAAYELASVECGNHPTRGQAILRLGKDGKYEWVESHAEGWQFIAALKCFKAVKSLKEG